MQPTHSERVLSFQSHHPINAKGYSESPHQSSINTSDKQLFIYRRIEKTDYMTFRAKLHFFYTSVNKELFVMIFTDEDCTSLTLQFLYAHVLLDAADCPIIVD